MIKNKIPRTWDTLLYVAELLKANADEIIEDIISVCYRANNKNLVEVHVVDIDSLAAIFDEIPMMDDEYNNSEASTQFGYILKFFIINNVKFFGFCHKEKEGAENVESN